MDSIALLEALLESIHQERLVAKTAQEYLSLTRHRDRLGTILETLRCERADLPVSRLGGERGARWEGGEEWRPLRKQGGRR
jgi:hypothetical protein